MEEKSWDVLPDAFLKKVREIYPLEELDGILSSFCIQRAVTFRANTLKISSADLFTKLTALGFLLENVVWFTDAFVLREGSKTMLMETELYKSGCFYIQSLSSMIPALLLDLKPTDMVGDICAAPGSKTSQMASYMGNKGVIVANDKSRARLYKLSAVLQQQGVTNVTISHLPGQAFWKRYPEYFDKMLVDVPCSMEGMFYCPDITSYQDWSIKKIKMLVQMQRFILRSAVSSVKPGGLIVYSTCTLSPEENEGIIDWIMEKEGDSLEVEEISLPISGIMHGLTKWHAKQFANGLANTMRVLPSDIMEGFYVAKLRKRKSTI